MVEKSFYHRHLASHSPSGLYAATSAIPSMPAVHARRWALVREMGPHDVGLDYVAMRVCYNQSPDDSDDHQIIGRGVELVLVDVASWGP